MTFQEIAARFEQSESGTDYFKNLYRDVFNLMKTDPENAALYFLVGNAARAYVRAYEDQGISPEFADRVKATLEGFNTKVIEALAAEPARRLSLASEIAIQYEWEIHDF
jgi:hypothetical protein